MHIVGARLTIATLSLAGTAGGTMVSASAAVPPHAVRHIGATLKATGHANTGKAFTFSVRTTLPHGDTLAGYTVDFGDHTKPTKGSKLVGNANHTYLRAGKYVVKLAATDRHHVTRRASLTEIVTGKTVSAVAAKGSTGASTDTGFGPSGLPNPPAGCNGTSTPGSNGYNTTPAGDGPWPVPNDPCNSEGIGESNDDIYANCDYWGAEKRPDIWSNAVLPYGYVDEPYGPWNVEEDAVKAGYPIDSTPRVGDLAAWNDESVMGTDSTGTEQDASPGGQVAYVEAVNPDGTIVISEMGAGANDGGYTYTLTFDPGTAFIHRR